MSKIYLKYRPFGGSKNSQRWPSPSTSYHDWIIDSKELERWPPPPASYDGDAQFPEYAPNILDRGTF